MAKRNVWLGARKGGVTTWIDAREDSTGASAHQDLLSGVAANLHVSSLDELATWLVAAAAAGAQLAVTGKRTGKAVKERAQAVDDRLCHPNWRTKGSLAAAFDATAAPARAILLDVDGRCVHLYRAGVVDDADLHALAHVEGDGVPADVVRVACVTYGDTAGPAAASSLPGMSVSEVLHAIVSEAAARSAGPFQNAAWEGALLRALADAGDRALLDQPLVDHFFAAPPKAGNDYVDAVLASRAARAKKAGAAAFVHDASDANLRKLAALKKRNVAHAMAARALPADVWDAVASFVDGDEELQLVLAKNASAPAALLEHLYKIGTDRVKDSLVENNAAAPLAIFEELLRDADLQRAVRAARWSPSPHARILAQHEQSSVRDMLADNPAIKAAAPQ